MSLTSMRNTCKQGSWLLWRTVQKVGSNGTGWWKQELWEFALKRMSKLKLYMFIAVVPYCTVRIPIVYAKKLHQWLYHSGLSETPQINWYGLAYYLQNNHKTILVFLFKIGLLVVISMGKLSGKNLTHYRPPMPFGNRKKYILNIFF